MTGATGKIINLLTLLTAHSHSFQHEYSLLCVSGLARVEGKYTKWTKSLDGNMHPDGEEVTKLATQSLYVFGST